MKKLILILFLVTTNVFAYQTHEEIDAITVNKVLRQLLADVYPECKYKVDEPNPYEFEFLINVLETEECAATLPKLTAILDLYKTNQHAILTYRTVLNAKKLEAKTLFLGFKDIYHSVAQRAGLPNIPNPAAWVRDNCDRVNTHEKVDACLVQLNTVNGKVAEVKAEFAAIEAAKNECDIDVATVQSFNVNSIDEMNTTQLKNVIKVIATIIKCRIK